MRFLFILLSLQLWGNLEVSFASDACAELPQVPHAFVMDRFQKAEYQEGDLIQFTCETGYISGPAIKYACTPAGWQAVHRGTCHLKPCQLPDDAANGYYEVINGEDLVFGTTVKYFCNEGFEMVRGQDTRTCLLNGWTHRAPVCERVVCQVAKMHPGLTATGLPQANARVNIGDKIQFYCSEQYELKGPEEIKCLEDGNWNFPFPTCSEKCKIPTALQDIRITSRVEGGDAKIGQKITFACRRPEHYMRGNATVECLADGQWSHPFPTCGVPSGCLRPPPLSNGDIKNLVKFQYSHEEKVEYICQSYYTLEGGPHMTCIDGEWTGEMRCLKPCTVTTEDMDRHRIRLAHRAADKIYSKHGDHISFTCKRGRPTYSPQFRQMCVDGVMLLPSC